MKRLLQVMGRVLRELVWIAIAAVVLFGGYLGFQRLGESRAVVEAVPFERPVTLVETTVLSPIDGPLPVRGDGFLRPYRSVELSALGGGRVVELHPALIDLQSQFAEGDVLVRLDDSAERASLEQIAASIAATEARLELNGIQLERAETLRESGSGSQSALDQLSAENAELTANLAGFRAAYAIGEIALENRLVRAPFDGAVLSKQADVGSVVGAGQSIAEIYTDGQLDVDIAIREAEAALIPGLFAGERTPANVTIRFAGRDVIWDAHVIRVAPDVDPETRTLSVTVEIADVAAGRSEDMAQFASGAPPALINSFARVVVSAAQPDQTYAIPATALRGGAAVWLMQDNALAIQPASLVHVDGETIYVRIEDMPPGARLILTELASPVPGLELRDVAEMAATAGSE
jgi:RND family efflux transporter MFP subunit